VRGIVLQCDQPLLTEEGDVAGDGESGSGFGRLLRRYRDEAGLTQEELAERAGLSVRAVSDMERGRTARPLQRSVWLLADALALPEAGRARLIGALLPAAEDVTGPGETSRADASTVIPRQLPAPVTHFAGRAAELKMLSSLLDRGHGDGAAIGAIGGTAGVGKTALAVHWAHRVAERFPGGQLYVDLRGYDPDQPLAPGDALAGFLRGLGVQGRDIPAETDERAASYRSLLAGRRMLLVLDNAASEAQVRPLLPGTAGCVTVVTSRDSLPGLIARDGARRLEVGLLPLADAVSLLRALIGKRTRAEPGATRGLAAACSRLPLALRVAAERAITYPDGSLTDLLAELADEQRRLDLLETGGDPRTAVRAVFSWSCRHLDSSAARAFRLAGLHPGPGFDLHAIAALTGTTSEQARDDLRVLTRAHLIQPGTPGRFGMHDLLRTYARERALAEDSQTTQATALTSLFDYYLGAAAAAMDVLFPAERGRRPRVAAPSAIPLPRMDDPADGLNWLDTELANLVAVVAYTAASDWPGHATLLASTLFRYLDSGAHYSEAITIHTSARAAARRLGDRAAEAQALKDLGTVEARQSRYRQASSHLLESLPLFRRVRDLAGEARALSNLGFISFQHGQYDEASEHLERSLTLRQKAGDLSGQARDLANLGLIGIRRGHYEQAAGYLLRALVLFGDSGDRRDEALALANLGEIDLRQGRYAQAIGRLQRSLAMCRESGDRQVEADALNGLGEAFLAAGRPDDARTHHAAAVDSASHIGNTYEQARAHNGLGRAHHALGDLGQARRQWQQALTLYESLGAPEADQIRAQLAIANTSGRLVTRAPAATMPIRT